MDAGRLKLLLAVDGSPGALRATELVAGYRGDASVLVPVVINVQAPPMVAWPEAAFDVREIEAALLESGEQLADAALRRLAEAGLRAQKAAVLNLPALGILREAEARGAALIVMGTRGHGALHGFAFGSVAMRVVHGAEKPVCLVQPEARLPAELGRRLRVMLAIDGSPPALRAAEQLAAWRGWLGELDVHIVYVQAPLSVLEAILPPHRDVIDQWSTRESEEATQAAVRLLAKAGIRHHLHLSVGDAAREISLLAEETQCELLMLGTRGRGAAHHALVGSVALKVAAASAVPAVLVK